MALSSTIYTITAGEVGDTEFDLTFEGYVDNPPGYIYKAHVFMWLNDVQVTEGGGAAEYGGSGITFSWVTSTRISISGYSAILDDKVEFRRTIPKDKPVVDFVDRAGITEAQLDRQSLANLYAVHEIMDGFGTGTQTYYALAKAYATLAEDAEVESGTYSALHWAAKAAASATAALASEGAASSSEDAAALSEIAAAASEDATALDAIATAADRVQTGLDAVATAADLVQTNLDQIDCAANQLLTAADVVLTHADVVLTNADVVTTSGHADDTAIAQTAAEAAQTAAELAETNAGTSETNAGLSEVLAGKWASEVEDVEVEAGKYSALHWAAKAEALAEDASGFPAGTIQLFGNNSAPIGWTRKSDWQEAAMIIVKATGDIASGGNVNAASAHSHSGPSHAHTTAAFTLTSAHVPAHQHYVVGNGSPVGGISQAYPVIFSANAGNDYSYTLAAASGSANYGLSNVSGAGGSHSHGNTGAGGTGATGANTAPYYQSVIAAEKD